MQKAGSRAVFQVQTYFSEGEMMNPFVPIEIFSLRFSEPGNKFIPKPKGRKITINHFGFNCYYWVFLFTVGSLLLMLFLKRTVECKEYKL